MTTISTPDLTLIFAYENSFGSKTMELITLIVAHVALFILEIMVVFVYGHPDDDKFNYGLVSKIIVIVAMHSVLSWALACGLDFSMQEWEFGYTAGFYVGKYMILAFVWKECVCHFVLTYATYYVDADNDRGILRPWSKALIWTLIKSTSWLIVYLIFWACTTDVAPSVKCDLLTIPDESTPTYLPEYGESGCIAKCKFHWMADPSICLQYETGDSDAFIIDSIRNAFLFANIMIGYIGYCLFQAIGIVYVPMIQWKKVRFAMKATPLKDDELKVKYAEVTEMANAMKTIGIGLRTRTTHLTRKDLSHLNPRFQYLDKKIGVDYNRWVRGCYILIEKKKAIDYRARLGSNNPPSMVSLHRVWAWTKFICATILCIVLLLRVIIWQIVDSLTASASFYPDHSPTSLMMKAVHELNVFPLTICVYLAIWGVSFYIILSGYQGVKVLWPFFGVPSRPMQKHMVRVREMTEATKVLMVISSAIPYIQARHEIDASNGSWAMRNFVSVMQYADPAISNEAPFEWVGLVLSATCLIWILVKNPMRLPFGLDEYNCKTKPNEIVRQWETGVKETDKNSKKSKFSSSRLKSKAGGAKNKVVMGAVKKNAGL